MRRIIACALVIGIAGLGGVGVVRCIAQTQPAAFKPEPFKPASSSNASNAVPTPPSPAESATPVIAPPADTLPVLSPDTALPVVMPPKDASTPTVPAVPTAPVMPAPVQAPAAIPALPSIDAPVIQKSADDRTSAFRSNEPKPMLPPDPMAEVKAKPAPEGASTPATAGGPNRVAPTVTIETIAPETAPFGQNVSYEIVVKNTGVVPVTHVRVDEEIGAASKLISSEPAAEVNGDKLLWMLGSLNVSEEKHIRLTVKPGDGDLTTKPRVAFAASTAMNVTVTRPNLTIAVNAAEMVQVGDDVPVQIQITNNGSGEASKIVLKAVLSEGLKHSEGNDIQALLNRLGPGENQKITLRIQAGSAGLQTCSLQATTDGSPKAATQVKVDIRQPKLTVSVSAPSKCIVRSEPTFTLEVGNPGTSATEPVQVALAFPEGLDYTTATDGGTYDPATRTVSWNMGPAAAGVKRTLTVKAKSTLAGPMSVRAVAQAGTKLNARAEAAIHADGVPALLFDVVDLEDPVEVGKEATYEIRLSNTGTMNCTNVRLTAALSDGLTPTQVSSTLPHKVVGQNMIFEPIAKMPVKTDMIIRVKAKGSTVGDHRFKVQLSCDQLKQPVIKEESTSFYQP